MKDFGGIALQEVKLLEVFQDNRPSAIVQDKIQQCPFLLAGNDQVYSLIVIMRSLWANRDFENAPLFNHAYSDAEAQHGEHRTPKSSVIIS